MTDFDNHAAGSERTLRSGRRGVLLALVAFGLGVAGLLFGGMAVNDVDSPGGGNPGGSGGSGGSGGVVVGSVRVFGAYVREPASPDVAAAYLSIQNTGDQPDELVSASSGASRTVTIHGADGGAASGTTSAGPGGGAGGGSEDPGTQGMSPSGPLTISGGTTVTLAPARGHLMLEGLAGPLRPGDRVSLLLTFQRAGQVLVDAPVVAIADPAPSGGTR